MAALSVFGHVSFARPHLHSRSQLLLLWLRMRTNRSPDAHAPTCRAAVPSRPSWFQILTAKRARMASPRILVTRNSKLETQNSKLETCSLHFSHSPARNK